ncbi:hypothetical protein EMIHUDRAFT_229092, partial [Emiliania huxleyi CCMP1516]|uniref:Uncharacterized protein n=2 Tax=Emiliania huxleyi TaxID=2903 RepID=A0A0D3KDZ5_EMIH1
MLTRRLSTASLACRARVQLSSRSGLSTLRLGLSPPRLIQQNRSRRGLDEEEERVRACAPVNADEILELRALNDVSSDTLATLADVAGAGARHDGAT